MALVKSAEERNRNKVGKSLAEQVAEKICRMIEEREGLSVGEKLPNENDFSRQLHVSRTTLREAVRIIPLTAKNYHRFLWMSGIYMKSG